MVPCSCACSQSHSARRLLPTPASPMIATILRAYWLRGGAPHTASTICQSFARSSSRAIIGDGRRLRSPGVSDWACAIAVPSAGRDDAGATRTAGALAMTSSIACVCAGLNAAQARRASAAYSKRCQGFFARSFCTKPLTPGGTSDGSSSGGHGRALVRAEDLLRVALEDLLADEDAVDDAAERVEIGCRSNQRGGAANLLGRDPTDRARARVHRRLRRRPAVEPRIVARTAQPRETEVEDVRARPLLRVRAAMSSITFDGLKSPWMTPRAWACASPASTWSTSAQIAENGIFVVYIHSCTLRPGSTSMTRNGEPSASCPKSRARTIAGCSSDATARASW